MTEFEGAGQIAGLQVWRIEDFKAVLWPKIGTFHTGDSYIVLKTLGIGGNLKHDIHFWLGKESSPDEYGTAAIKAVELDDMLGGAPVQHREVQGHESALFESYFEKGVKYIPGGVASGFNDVDTDVDPDKIHKRLFMVKGKKQCVKVEQVELAFSSLNKSDCFVLDLGKGKDVLAFMPEGASAFERFKASQVANDIRDEDHAGDAKVEVIDAFSEQAEMFFEALGGGCSDDLPESPDVESENEAKVEIVLYRVHDSEVTEVAKGSQMSQTMLEPDDCFILDTKSSNGIFVWIGQKSTKEERIGALKSAETFLAEQNLPNWTRIERIVEKAETTMFKEYFESWTDA